MDLGKRIERRLKRRLFGLLAGGVDGGPRPADVDLRGVQRVLLVRANVRLGNLLLITPAIAAARHALPLARIDVLCDAAYGSLLGSDPAVDSVIPVDRRILRNPIALARLVWRLRRMRYDLAIECARGGSFLGAILTGMSGGRLRVGSAGGRYERLFNVRVARGQRTHKVDLLLDLLAGIGVPPVGRDVRVVLTDAERAVAARRWAAWGVPPDAPLIGVNLGGRGRKRWPIECFVELIRHLRLVAGAHVAVFAGPEERSLPARAAPSPSSSKAITVPVLPVREFAAMLARCTVVITTDTGPMHLAAAVGTPTVVIVRTPSSSAYVPRGSGHRLVDADECSVEQVVRAVSEVLRERAASPAA